MPSGRHLRGLTLPMAATRANSVASKVSKALRHRDCVLCCVSPFNRDLICQLNRGPETQALALSSVQNGVSELTHPSITACYNISYNINFKSIGASLLPTNPFCGILQAF